MLKRINAHANLPQTIRSENYTSLNISGKAIFLYKLRWKPHLKEPRKRFILRDHSPYSGSSGEIKASTLSRGRKYEPRRNRWLVLNKELRAHITEDFPINCAGKTGNFHEE